MHNLPESVSRPLAHSTRLEPFAGNGCRCPCQIRFSAIPVIEPYCHLYSSQNLSKLSCGIHNLHSILKNFRHGQFLGIALLSSLLSRLTPAPLQPRAPASKAPVVKYSIDVSKPAKDRILDSATLEKFLRENIKVEGKTGQLGDNIKVVRDGNSPVDTWFLVHLTFG